MRSVRSEIRVDGDEIKGKLPGAVGSATEKFSASAFDLDSASNRSTAGLLLSVRYCISASEPDAGVFCMETPM